jgi:hypothetical protein
VAPAALSAALVLAISADILRPSLSWAVAGATGQGALMRNMACRDPRGFTGLRALCASDPDVSPAVASLTLHRSAVIVAAKGGRLADITVGDHQPQCHSAGAADGWCCAIRMTLPVAVARRAHLSGLNSPPSAVIGHYLPRSSGGVAPCS